MMKFIKEPHFGCLNIQNTRKTFGVNRGNQLSFVCESGLFKKT